MLTLNWNIIWIFVNLIVLYLLLNKFLFGRVQDILKQREELINSSIESAKANEEIAKENVVKAQVMVDNAKKEAEEKANSIIEKAKKEEKERIEASENEARRILKETREIAEIERNRILAEAKDDMVTMAMLTARKAVGTMDNEEKERELFEDLLKKVGDA